MTVTPIKMNATKLLDTLRTAGAWPIALLCLLLMLPAAGSAYPSFEGPVRQFELVAQDIGAELLGSPVEPAGYSKQSAPCRETQTFAGHYVKAGQLSPLRPVSPRIISTLPWFVGSHPLFLPRPPPFS